MMFACPSIREAFLTLQSDVLLANRRTAMLSTYSYFWLSNMFSVGPSLFCLSPSILQWTKIKAPHLLQSWLASPLHENNQRGVTSCGIWTKFKFVWGQTQQSSTFAHHFRPSLAGVGGWRKKPNCTFTGNSDSPWAGAEPSQVRLRLGRARWIWTISQYSQHSLIFFELLR